MTEIPVYLAHAIRDVRRAVQNEGPVPKHHRAVMARHRREWPALWEAIDRLMQP